MPVNKPTTELIPLPAAPTARLDLGLTLLAELETQRALTRAAWRQLFEIWLTAQPASATRNRLRGFAAERARAARDRVYGRRVFMRGLIEYSNYCANNCYYCGIRAARPDLERYRLSPEQVFEACADAVALDIHTFVLQGGENAGDDRLIPELVREIRRRWPEQAITLSLGEKTPEVYRRFREAGADRYLLRHETALESHYRQLHPASMQLDHRLDCLRTLKALGFQAGCGFMIGSPGQSALSLAEDFLLITELAPQMLGIGPFIPHPATPFAKEPAGSIEDTLFYLSLARLLRPDLLLPSTTALATLAKEGHVIGLEAGANVIMPNMTPVAERARYTLYEGKKNSGTEAREGYAELCRQVRAAGYEVAPVRGDWQAESSHAPPGKTAF